LGENLRNVIDKFALIEFLNVFMFSESERSIMKKKERKRKKNWEVSKPSL